MTAPAPGPDRKDGNRLLGRTAWAVSLAGLVCLSCLLGAAGVYFQLPGFGSVKKAFVGGEAFMQWGKPGPGLRSVRTPRPGVSVDKPDKTSDGFTLLTTTADRGARLVDMRGNVVHRWTMPFSKAISQPRRTPVADEHIHWFACHLYPNGDLLAIYQSEVDTPVGYGLAKLDCDSKVLWTLQAGVHHSVDVGADGTIYTLGTEVLHGPVTGLEFIEPPVLTDFVLVLSPEGKEIAKVSVLESYRDSPYALTTTLIEENESKTGPTAPMHPMPMHPMPMHPMPMHPMPPMPEKGAAKEFLPKGPPPRPVGPSIPPPRMGGPVRVGTPKGDILHTNSVRVLNPGLAAKFPLFAPGQVLISMRSLDTLGVLDLAKRKIVWSAQGLWKAQHSPEFLDNGRLLVYDNYGSSKGTRVLEFDPNTGAIPWCYANENSVPFTAVTRGMASRLPNGNTLIVDSDGLRVFEVTLQKELVWEFGCQDPERTDPKERSQPSLTCARRYPAEQLTFLKEEVRVRP
jgi:hypothetical protein